MKAKRRHGCRGTGAWGRGWVAGLVLMVAASSSATEDYRSINRFLRWQDKRGAKERQGDRKAAGGFGKMRREECFTSGLV